ncbi:MAG: signal recognition particle-docking protein FtsY [Dehalococcoidia bacterium]|nr:signal recognition particle-docking protein FtsY [Dehalococcoidia bacterium]
MRFWRKKKQDEAPSAAEATPRPGDAALAVATAALEPETSIEEQPELEQFDDVDDEFEEYTPEEQAEVHEQTERALERTRRGFFGRLAGIFQSSDFDESLWDDLEEVLIASDAGLPTTDEILARVRKRVRDEGVKQSARVREILREELIDILRAPAHQPPAWARKPIPPLLILLVVGVNGAGKTTTIAKMSHAFKRDGATVVLGAADTFRAAATDQLKVWGERIGVRVVAHQPGADPGAVVFDTLSAAEASRADIVIVDTAGRLHTKTNLMEELKKMDRIIQRNHPDGPHETLLVLDATTGQNGLTQARTFAEAVGVTGIVLAKLDGTAKGGIAFAIAHELNIPVRFIGTGERMDDLAPFDARDFVDSLLA